MNKEAADRLVWCPADRHRQHWKSLASPLDATQCTVQYYCTPDPMPVVLPLPTPVQAQRPPDHRVADERHTLER